MSEIHPKVQEIKEDEEDYENEPDETLAERLCALKEVFPECVRNATDYIFSRRFYDHSRQLVYAVMTTGFILVLPLLVETERANLEASLEEMQRKQRLYGPGMGPNIAFSGQPEPY